MPAEKKVVQASNLCKIYEIDDVKVEAFRDVSFSVENGEFTAIGGPSGCGNCCGTKFHCFACKLRYWNCVGRHHNFDDFDSRTVSYELHHYGNSWVAAGNFISNFHF